MFPENKRITTTYTRKRLRTCFKMILKRKMKLGSNIVLTSYAMLNDLKNLAGKIILVKQEHAFPTGLNG